MKLSRLKNGLMTCGFAVLFALVLTACPAGLDPAWKALNRTVIAFDIPARPVTASMDDVRALLGGDFSIYIQTGITADTARVYGPYAARAGTRLQVTDIPSGGYKDMLIVAVPRPKPASEGPAQPIILAPGQTLEDALLEQYSWEDGGIVYYNDFSESVACVHLKNIAILEGQVNQIKATLKPITPRVISEIGGTTELMGSSLMPARKFLRIDNLQSLIFDADTSTRFDLRLEIDEAAGPVAGAVFRPDGSSAGQFALRSVDGKLYIPRDLLLPSCFVYLTYNYSFNLQVRIIREMIPPPATPGVYYVNSTGGGDGKTPATAMTLGDAFVAIYSSASAGPFTVNVLEDITLYSIDEFQVTKKVTVRGWDPVANVPVPRSIVLGGTRSGTIFAAQVGSELTLASISIAGDTTLSYYAQAALINIAPGGFVRLANGAELRDNVVPVSGDGGVMVNGGQLVMENGSAIRNCIAPMGGAVFVGEGSGSQGKFVMNGGIIENCEAGYGGAVAVYSNARFEMTAGTIGGSSPNKATYGGGAVYVYGTSASAQIGGPASISWNQTTDSAGEGGAFFIEGGAVVVMSGGNLLANTSSKGGAVSLRNTGSRFEQSAGGIRNNTATLGGGVFAGDGSQYKLTGGTVGGETDQGNNASELGGGVYIATGAIFDIATLTAVHIRANKTPELAAGLYLEQGSTFTFNGMTKNWKTAITENILTAPIHTGLVNTAQQHMVFNFASMPVLDTTDVIPAHLVVTANLDVNTSVAVRTGVSISTDSATPVTLTRAGGLSTPLFTVLAGGNLVLGKNITVSGTNNAAFDKSSLISVSGTGSRLVMLPDSILQNNMFNDGGSMGGAVFVDGTAPAPRAAFDMKGGTIRTCSAVLGGAVFLFNGAIMTMSGGMIGDNATLANGNTAISDGGAVYIDGGSLNNTQFKMNGGLIAYNQAYHGGAVYMKAAAGGNTYLTLNNGSITFNTATGNGGGIHALQNSWIELHTTQIHENEANQGGGLYMSQGTLNILSDPPPSPRLFLVNVGILGADLYLYDSVYNIPSGTFIDDYADGIYIGP